MEVKGIDLSLKFLLLAEDGAHNEDTIILEGLIFRLIVIAWHLFYFAKNTLENQNLMQCLMHCIMLSIINLSRGRGGQMFEAYCDKLNLSL